MFSRTRVSTNSFFLSRNEFVVLWSDNVEMPAFDVERAVVGCRRILVTITTHTQRLSLV